MTVTKKAFAIADYHQIVGHWVTLSGVNDGEIIDVYSSLGQRPASSLTIESYDGATTVRLNVCQIVHKRQTTDNPFITDAGFYTKPLKVDEIEIEKDDIYIPSGAVFSLYNDIPIKDIKVVTVPSGTKITFA